MNPSGLGPGPQAHRMSIAYLAPARRDPSPGYARHPSNSSSSYADEHSGPAARSTARSDEFASNLPPSFDWTRASEEYRSEEEDTSNRSVTPSSYGDVNDKRETPKSGSRDPRPSYTEEQKFFIMWARIVQQKNWPEIEQAFHKHWDLRTKGGLTSVYYRIRKNWKLRDVQSSDASSSEADRMAVADRVKNFSEHFLQLIGYRDESMTYMMSDLEDHFHTGCR